MILEIAQIDVKQGMEEQFEAKVTEAVPLFQRAKGCRGMALHRSSEVPNRYRLFVDWERLENHTVDFRQSARSQRAIQLRVQCGLPHRARP